jgi:hypothetical protein
LLGCRLDAGLVEDFPDGGCGELGPQGQQLAVDALVSPAIGFACQAQHERADGPHGGWPADTFSLDPWIGLGVISLVGRGDLVE